MHRTVVSAMNHPDPLKPYMGLFNFRSIRAISAEEAAVDVVSPRPIAPPFGPYSAYGTIPETYDYGSHTVHYPRFAYLLPQRIFKYTLSASAISRMLPAYVSEHFSTPDVCHAGHIHYDGYGLRSYCEDQNLPLTVMGRGKILNNYDGMSFVARRKIRETLEYASRILCVSGSLAEIAAGIVDGSKVEVLPNGADPDRYPTDSDERIRAELGIAPETAVVLFCGGYTERKGIEEIIEALETLDHEDVHLVFVGHYGSLRGDLIRALQRSPHDSYRVLWEVPPLALRRWFAIADVFMLPSHAEGRPNTVYEAMASETAVVGSAVSGIPEQVADGETGILIPPRDAPALANALNRLIRDPELRTRMGEKGRDRLVANDWTWEAHGKRLHRIHETVIEEW
jgi:glycosyltransferase involved in cell wall biosynthesis